MNPFDDWMPVSDHLFPFVGDWVTGGICYIVHWPKYGVVKAGSTAYPSRYRKFVHRGAELVYVRQGTKELSGLHDELAWQRLMRDLGGEGFGSKAESLRFLGDGSGWTECYMLGDDALGLLALEIRKRANALV